MHSADKLNCRDVHTEIYYIEKKTHFLNDVDLLSSSSIILYYSMNTRVVCILEYYYYYVVLPRVERNFLIFFLFDLLRALRQIYAMIDTQPVLFINVSNSIYDFIPDQMLCVLYLGSIITVPI